MSSPLCSVAELYAILKTDSLRLIDIRKVPLSGSGRELYDQAHLPGAIFLDLDSDLSAAQGFGRHPLPKATLLSQTLAQNGIGPEHTIVCYDNFSGAIAARAWWMIESLGHSAVSVLDGGIDAWKTAGHPLESRLPHFPTVTWNSGIYQHPTIDGDTLTTNLRNICIVDARSEMRYQGLDEHLDPVAGHIPGSLSAPFSGNMRNGSFKSPAQLRERFASMGIHSAARVVSSCGSGVTACHNILAMRVAGLGQATLYPGSWSDWCLRDRNAFPIATGP